MKTTLIRQEILPFGLSLIGLFLLTVYLDMMLHYFSWAWLGRYLGYPGMALILASFAYSLRKRGLIRFSTPKRLLDLHELLTLVGSAFICVHAGVHFNAWLPWMALVVMLTTVVSGLVGRVLLKRSQQLLKLMKTELKAAGKTKAEIELSLQDTSTMTDHMKQWRVVHIGFSYAFFILVAVHVLSIWLLGGSL